MIQCIKLILIFCDSKWKNVGKLSISVAIISKKWQLILKSIGIESILLYQGKRKFQKMAHVWNCLDFAILYLFASLFNIYYQNMKDFISRDCFSKDIFLLRMHYKQGRLCRINYLNTIIAKYFLCRVIAFLFYCQNIGHF